MLGFNKGSTASEGRAGSPLEQKLRVMRERLGQMNEQGSEGLNGDGMAQMGKEPQTLADDGQMAAEKQAQIQQDEALIRPVLALLGVDYDALIQLNTPGATSAYQRAVEANPAVLQQVLQHERPVLAALQVALGFKPYAEFIDKYGNDPQSIRTAIRAEMEGELAATPAETQSEGEQPPVTPFSRNGRQAAAPKAAAKGQVPLGEIFKR